MSQRKLKIARISVAVLFALVASLLVMTACAPKAEQCTIEWDTANATHLIVSADGFDELPTSVDKGTSLSFTVSPDSAGNYAVDTVKRGTTTMQLKNGKYTYTVNNDVKFTITEKKVVKDITATPASGVTFLAGDTVERGDLVVTVNYKDGTHDTLNWGDYSIQYQGGAEATCISLGDTSIGVSYSGIQASITIPATKAQITINPVAGVLGDEFLGALEKRAGTDGDLADFQKDADTGIVTFTYVALTKGAITLPTKMDVREGLTIQNPILKSWAIVSDSEVVEITQITTDNKVSLNIQAQYDAKIVTFKSVDLKLDNGVPTLEVTFTKPQAAGAYIFLYEGTQKFTVKGEPFDIPATGEDMTVDFDLRKLAASTNATGEHFWGGWMDIRVAVEINGVVFSDTVVMSDDIDVDMGKMVHDNENCYRFIHYVNKGNLELKVYFNRYAYDYEVKVKDGDKPTLEVSGHINTKLDDKFTYDGADVTLTLGTYSLTGKVAADGSFTATLDLTTVEHNSNVTAGTFTVTSGGKTLNTNVYEKGALTKSTLDLIGCGTLFTDFDEKAGNNRNYFTAVTASNGWIYTVGTDWNEFFMIAQDSARIVKIIDDVELRLNAEKTKVYYVVTIESGSAYNETNLKTLAEFGDGDNRIEPDVVNKLADGKFELCFDVTSIKPGRLYAHLWVNGGTWDGSGGGDIKDPDHSAHGTSVKLGRYQYSISSAVSGTDYDMANLLVEDKTVEIVGDVALKLDNITNPTKVYYVVTVSSVSDKETVLKKIYFGNADGSQELYAREKVEDVSEGIYRLWFDITACDNTQLWSNLYLQSGEGDAIVYEKLVEIKDADSSTDGLFAIVGGKKYTIRSTKDTYYNSACVVVGAPEDDDVNDTNKLDPDKWDEITEPEPEPDYSLPEGAQFELTAVTIEGTDSAAYYVVSGTFSGCTADQIKGYLENAYYFDFQLVGGNYARHATLPRTVTAADGAFTMKIDVTSLDTNRYGTHYGDEDTNFTLSAEAAPNATKVTVGNKIYEMVNVPGSNQDNECWGTVGLWVQSTIVIPAMTFSDMTVELETDQSKLYYTITITFTDADADDTKIVEWLKSITLEDTGYSKSVAKHVKVAEKKYKVYFDVSDYSGTQLWPHIKYMGNGWDKSNGDVKCGGSGSVSFNGKTYYYEDGWGMPTMKVS